MHGRRAAFDAVRMLLEQAADSRASILAVDGEPGIGKSAVCAHAMTSAAQAGFDVVAAGGVQWESQLQLAALSQILRPMREVFGLLPPRHRATLDAALELAESMPPDLHNLSVATLSCLARMAERRPLLVVLDDTHWLDATSAGVLGFALRRLDVDAVAVLLAGRPQSRPLDGPWPRLMLEALDADAVMSLLVQTRPDLPVPAQPVLDEIVERTAGNPLALLELAPLLDLPKVLGAERLPDPLPLGVRGQLSMGGAVAALPERTLRALVVVAAAGSQPQLIRPALSRFGLVIDDLDAALDAGMLVAGAHPAFTHPLRRAAAYDAAPASYRRAVHAALADLTGETEAEQYAWHLDAAGSDAYVVAEAMERAAAVITHRAGPAAAAESWQRAAALSGDPAQRATRAVRAAAALFLLGDRVGAERYIGEALSGAGPPEVIAEATLLRCQVSVWHASGEDDLPSLARAVDRLAAIDALTAARAALNIAAGCTTFGHLDRAWDFAQLAQNLIDHVPEEHAALVRLGVLNHEVLCRGGASAPLASDLIALEDAMALHPSFPDMFWPIVHAVQWQADFGFAQQLLDPLIEHARKNATFASLPYLLTVQGEQWWWTGSWQRAWAVSQEALALAEQTGQVTFFGYSRAIAGTIAGCLGRREEAIELAHAALNHAEETGQRPVRLYALQGLGLLELGDGNNQAAVEHLEAAHAVATETGMATPNIVPYIADLAEALVRCGNHARAAEVIAEIEVSIAHSGSSWGRAVLPRCRVLLDPDADDAEQLLHASLTAFADAQPIPFEVARTQLTLGELPRRRRRLPEARRALRQAGETFQRLGAVAWQAKADAERRAAGDRDVASPGRLNTETITPAGALTPQQLQVCLHVARGGTNREVAAALFLSPKTVDYHLRRACLILGIRSRVDLARLVAQGALG